MRRYFIILLLFALVECAFSQEKKVKVNGLVYMIDLKEQKASVGHNYKKTLSGSIKGTAKGAVEILPFVFYNNEKYPVESIDNLAFLSCDMLTSISLPASLRYINYETFDNLPLLAEFNVDPENQHFKSVDGVLYSKSMKTIIKYPQAKINTSFQIPLSVKHISFSAFSSCKNIIDLHLPDSLESIGERAFYNCSFDHIQIPESTDSIGAGAFCLCYYLKSIKIPFQVNKVGDKAFEYCSNLEHFIYQNDELVMPSNSFEKCSKLLKGGIIFEAPISIFLNLAQQGVVKYQFKTGVCFLKGYGVKQSIDSALVWFNKSAENGYLDSQVGLGVMYYNGNHVKKDINKGVKWLTIAAERGDTLAQFMLGNHYYSGAYVKKNVTTALKFYQLAANSGFAKAEGMLASIYFWGDDNVKYDYNKAFEWSKKAAEHKDTLSFYTLGLCYNEGLGIKENKDLAFYWIEKAFKSGVEKAKTLYLSLAYGEAIEKMGYGEYDKAISLFSDVLIYDSKNVDCLINRGYCYLNQNNIEYNKAKVDFEEVLDIDKDNVIAKNNLDIVKSYFQRVEEANRLNNVAYRCCNSGDYINTIAYCSQSISLDNSKPYPYYLIGYCYSVNGLYVDAIRFFDKALEVDPNYADAIKARKSARTLAVLTTITQALTAVSNSFNSVYNGSTNYASTYQTSSQSSLKDSKKAGRLQEVSCSYCHGTGSDPYPSYSVNFGLGETIKNERCNICGKYESHYHKNCPSCNGKGVNKKFVP